MERRTLLYVRRSTIMETVDDYLARGGVITILPPLPEEDWGEGWEEAEAEPEPEPEPDDCV
jgi:hypothetical protein